MKALLIPLFSFTLFYASTSFASLPSCQNNDSAVLCDNQFKSLKRLARNGSPEAMVTLGVLYSTGQHGLEQNFDKAFKYFRKAAKKRSPVAQMEMAKLYLSGMGVEKNQEIALNYLNNAIKQNYEEAKALKLAIVLADDNLTDKARGKAIEELVALSSKPTTDADFFLGKYYLTEDPKQAQHYLSVASSRGHLRAQTLIDEHFKGQMQFVSNVDFNSQDTEIERITVNPDFTFSQSIDTIITMAKVSYNKKTSGFRLHGQSCIEERTCYSVGGTVGLQRIVSKLTYLANMGF